MEEAVNRFNLEIAVFLKQLKAFRAKDDVQLGQTTVALLMDTVSMIDELTTNRNLNEFIKESGVDFLLNLNKQHFELRQYIMCRLCLEQISTGYDDFLAHLHKKRHLKAVYGDSLNGNHEEVNVAHSTPENRSSYANVLGTMTNESQSKMATSNPSDKVLQKSVEQLNPPNVLKHKTARFNSDSTHLIRLRGLSWAVTKKEIRRFLAGANILNDLDGIHFIIDDELQFGQAFVQLASTKDYLVAQKKHKKIMGDDDDQRYIEVLGASTDHFKRLISKRNPILDDKIVRIDNLRVGTTETDMRAFFHGSQIDAVHMVYYGDESILKEVFIQFSSVDGADGAIKRNGEMLRNRNIKVYRSSEYQMQCRTAGYQIGETAQNDSPTLPMVDSCSTSELNGSLPDISAHCSHMVMATGFPWNVTKAEVRTFFKGLNILHGDKGISLVKNIAMRAYVQFASKKDQQKALLKNKTMLNARPIYVIPTEYSDFCGKADAKKDAEFVVRISGLPFSVDKRYIVHLFNGLKIVEEDGIQIELDRLNRRTGIAFVEFQSSEDLRAALNANVKKVNEYLKVYKSSKKELLKVKNLNASIAEQYGSYNYDTGDEVELPAFYFTG